MDDLEEFEGNEGALRRVNVLYLLDQLEQAVERGGVGWTVEDAQTVPERLAKVCSVIVQQAAS